MEEDTEFCRVCRGEGTDDQPLFHPCKCSGSIRYVHQDCLIQWLSHSRKKHCELCNHQFTFTPVYRNDMPDTLPWYLVAKGLFFQLINLLVLFIRVDFVTIIWLIFLPNFISNLSRGSFLFVKRFFNYFAVLRPEFLRPNSIDAIAADVPKNISKISGIDLIPSVTYDFLFRKSHDDWGKYTKVSAWLLSESIEGVLIILTVVISGLLVFLIREWVVQNNFEFNENGEEQANGRNPQIRRGPVRPVRPRIGRNVNAPGEVDHQADNLVNDNPGLLPHINQQHAGLNGANMPLFNRAQEHAGINPPGPNLNQNNIGIRPNMNPPADPFLLNQNDIPQQPNSSIAGSNSSNLENNLVGASGSSRTSINLPNNPFDTHSTNQPTSTISSSSLNQNQHGTNPFAQDLPRSDNLASTSSFQGARTHSSISNNDTLFSSPQNASNQNNNPFNINRTPVNPLDPNNARDSFNNTSGSSSTLSNRPSSSVSQSPTTSAYAPNRPTHGYNLRSRRNLANNQTNNQTNNPVNDPFVPTESQNSRPDESNLIHNTSTSQPTVPDRAPSPQDRPDPDFVPVFQRPHAQPRHDLVQRQRDVLGNDPIPRVIPEPVAPPRPPVNLPVDPPEIVFAADNGNEEAADPRVREEIDGLMEALGIRGPLLPVVQNYVTVLLILSVAFTIFAIFPYFMGHLTLLIEPISFSQSLLNLLRAITDPIFDLVFDVVIPLFVKTINRSSEFVFNFLRKIITSDIYIPEFKLGWRLVEPAISNIDMADNPLVEAASDTVFGRLFDSYIQWYMAFYNFCNQQTLFSRLLVIAIGYLSGVVSVTSFIILIPAENLTDPTLINIRRQIVLGGLMLRVTMFLVMEIILFPTFYGLIINLLFLSVFKDGTYANRFDFIVQNPLTATFLHWCLGTVFMFHFATFLKKCREYFRPGVMWFVRDPADPNFHPFREILHRPILTQLKKIAYSCLLYLSIILISRLAVIPTLGNPIAPVIPIRLVNFKDFAKLHMIYLLFQLIPPAHFLSNSPIWSGLLKYYQESMRDIAAYLRLSSFLFHTRNTAEEATMVPKTFWGYFIPFPKPDSPFHERRPDGGILMVPTKDHIVIAPNRRVIIPLGADLNPIDSTVETPSYPTTMVYAPPRFYFRLFVFVFLMFFIGFGTLSLIYVIPTLFARNLIYPLISFIIDSPIKEQDGVDFLAGLMVLVAFSYVYKFNQTEIQRLRRSERTEFTFNFITRLKLFQYNISVVYIAFIVNFFTPTLVGFFSEPYLYYALGKYYQPELNFVEVYINSNPIIVVFERWLLGSMVVQILHDILSHLPANEFSIWFNRNFHNIEIFQHHFTAVNEQVLYPTVLKLSTMILYPILSAILFSKYFTEQPFQQHLPTIYQVNLGALILVGMERYFNTHFHVWINQIRDDYYLMGQTLHNLDPNNTREATNDMN